jgi:hypothetical protein
MSISQLLEQLENITDQFWNALYMPYETIAFGEQKHYMKVRLKPIFSMKSPFGEQAQNMYIR